MQNGFTSNHFNDKDDNPGGGSTFGCGFAIEWQNGPLGRDADRVVPNGAFVEDVIAAAKDRIEYYQSSQFACEENAKAIVHLDKALAYLADRTASRETRGVEGTHVV